MLTRSRAAALTLAAALLVPAPSWAARPLVTEDASITAPGTCTIETWTNRFTERSESWLLPRCAVGAWEIAAGIGRLRPPRTGLASHSGLLAAKTVFRPLRNNSWGIGLVLSNQFGGGRGAAGDLAAVIPLSVSLLDDRWRLHLNVGWQRPRGEHSGANWALATEWNVTRRTGLTLESYGSQHGRAYLQAGGRYDLLPRRLTLDAAVGQRLTLRGEERYVAIGLTFIIREPWSRNPLP